MGDQRALLVSVKPHYADLILAGSKTVELRRVRPQVDVGTLVLLYASSPRMKLVGTARIANVESGESSEIWSQHSSRVGLDRTAFDAYFDGATVAVAITLCDVRPLRRAVPLTELRKRIRGFRPPQSFRYLPSNQASLATK